MKHKLILVAVGAFLFLLYGSMYRVHQTEFALVLQFGNPVKVVSEPGLNLKQPFFLQTVVKLDKRVLDLNAEPREVIAADQKRLMIDAFAKYKIADPLKFYQSVRDERGVRARLNSILDSKLRETVGSIPMSQLLSAERVNIMKTAQERVNAEAKSFGVDVVDVRIMRADLPQENSQRIFNRMNTEREREAKEFRAQGAEEAQRISSKAEKERTILLAEAQKKAQELRGEGDAAANRIVADVSSKDPEFFRFYRTLQAYQNALPPENTRLVLSPNSDFLHYLNDGDR